MASLTGKLVELRDGIQSSSLRGSAGKKGKKKKKKKKRKKRNTTEEKTESICEQKKRGHPSTTSYSDDSEKPQTQQQQQSTNTEKSSDPNHAKGRAKERSATKGRKAKKTQGSIEERLTVNKTDGTEASRQKQESLRWEGALDDPAAEAERLEVYKANRRKRYMAFKQTLSENAKEV